MSEFTNLLLALQNNDGAIRNAANDQLLLMREQDFGTFFTYLCAEMVSIDRPQRARQAAALVMKMSLDSRDVQLKLAFQQSWKNLSPEMRFQIKSGVLQTLQCELRDVSAAAAQAASKIAAIEVPLGLWSDLLSVLIDNMKSPNMYLRMSTLDCLGYLCEVLPGDSVAGCADYILSAVIQGLRAEEPSFEVKVSASKALCSVLEYVRDPFDNQEHRDYIMTVVCNAAECGDQTVRQKSLECIVKIMQFFYTKMTTYMTELFRITINSITNDSEAGALQSIEFWNTVAEEERYLHAQDLKAKKANQVVNSECMDYIGHALPHLLPILFQAMVRQDPQQDEDTWNLSMAAGTCLGMCAEAVGDAIVSHVIEFITGNVSNPDWHFREASIFAFGSILEGVSSEAVANLINVGLGDFVNRMNDEIVLVGETAAWTLGRICKFHSKAVSDPNVVVALINALLLGLDRDPRVATNCCWAIHNLAIEHDGADADTYILSNVFEIIIAKILAIAERADASEANLRAAAYTCVNVLISRSATDCLPAISKAFVLLMDRLRNTLAQGGGDSEELAERQSLVCGVLQVITDKVGADIAQPAPEMMELYLGVFACKSASVHEEALLAVSSLATALGRNFGIFMPRFMPWLEGGLANVQEYGVCGVAIGCVGDLSRALEEDLAPYTPAIFTHLINDLKSDLLHRDVKPAILALFGDIALAIGAQFINYLETAMVFLNEAAQTVIDESNPTLVEYQNELRENIFEGYTGIIQGLNSAGRADALINYTEMIVAFIQHVYADRNRTEPVTRGAVGVLGDLAHSLGNRVAGYLQREWVMPLVRECRNGEDPESQVAADFTSRMIKTLNRA